jgi:predicted Zn-dependent protease
LPPEVLMPVAHLPDSVSAQEAGSVLTSFSPSTAEADAKAVAYSSTSATVPPVALNVPGADWEFIVFEVPNQINAFAMAGGKVGVFSGLFKITKNDDQLASVIAHEIAHVTAKHIHERLSQQMLISGGSLATGVAMMGTGVGSLGTVAVMQAYGISTGAAALAYDRGKEKEADYIGLMYMARAGYDPQAAIQVIEALDAESAGRPLPPAILSTHPSNPERLIQLMDAMPKALEARAKASVQAKPTLVK